MHIQENFGSIFEVVFLVVVWFDEEEKNELLKGAERKRS